MDRLGVKRWKAGRLVKGPAEGVSLAIEGQSRDQSLRPKRTAGGTRSFRRLCTPMSELQPELKRTKLYDLHVALGAKMVPFAGYDMPVQYPMGVLKEHLHTREKAGLFDVSHMGQCFINAKDGQFETAAKALEKLVPASLQDLKPGQQRYSQFLNADGGMMDDLMITRLGYEGHTHRLY